MTDDNEIIDPAIRERIAVVRQATSMLSASTMFGPIPTARDIDDIIDLSEYLTRGHSWVHEREPELARDHMLAEVKVLAARQKYLAKYGTDGSGPSVGFMEVGPDHPLFNLFRHLFADDVKETEEQTTDGPTDPGVVDVEPDAVPDVDETPTQKPSPEGSEDDDNWGDYNDPWVGRLAEVKTTHRRGVIIDSHHRLAWYRIRHDDGTGAAETRNYRADEFILVRDTPQS